MKRMYFLAVIFLSVCLGSMAQPPSGGGRPGGMGGPGGRPPMRSEQGGGNSGQFWVMKVPDIPGMTQDQRRKLVDALSKEEEDVSKLMDSKKELDLKELRYAGLSQKDKEKQMKKIAKIDSKIDKTREKYDKKYRKILTEEQYRIFIEKKKDVEFKGQGRSKNRFPDSPNGDSPERRDGQERHFNEGDTPPEMPSGDDF